MTTRVFGERVERREDPRLLRGEGRYLDDLGHDALEVAFVRSPHAHARVLDVDVTAALDVEGLVAIYTHEDLPGRLADPLPLLIPHPALTAPRTAHALAKDLVRHVGEPVVMVVAADRYLAEDAADRVRVTYEVLPPVVGLDRAEEVAAHLVQEVGDVDAALAAAPRTLELRLDIERSASTPLEGRGVYARWDADDQRLRVYSSTQTPTSVRFAVAAILGLPDSQVECVAPDVGGGFGVKIMHPWPEEVLVPWAARLLGREVKYTEDRREHFVAATHERAQEQHVRVGFDDDGRILALDVRFLHDHGAYTPYGIIVPIITSTQLPGPYVLPAYRVEFSSLYTNTVPVTPYRGAGRPQAAFCMERTVDRIAAELGLDRAEVRRRNIVQPEQMPYDLGLTFQDGRPAIYDSGDFPATLRMITDLIGWDDFPRRKAEAAAEGRRIGIGLACYVEGTGVGPYEGGHVQVEPNGRVNVSTGLSSQGQGHQTVFAQIVATELGVPMEDVHVVTGDTRRFGYAVGTFASRAAVMSGNAIALAARELRAKALRIAADALEASPDDLEIVEGIVRVKGSPDAAIPLRTVAVLSNPLRYSFSEESRAATQFSLPVRGGPPVPRGEAPGLEGRDYYSPERSTFANGMHAAIVEVDPETADVTILRYAVVHDCGNLINPMIVEGQIHGGVAQGVAGALYERMAYDEHGQLQNASFMDFLMPYATEVPHIEIAHLETPSPLNPLGIKGAGEAGVIPGSAVLAAAIEDATGVAIARMPVSPSELFELQGGFGVRVSGTHDLAAPPARVWAALTEPAVLARTIPGALALQRVGADEYRVTVEAGVASIRGVYDGVVALGDLDPPRGYTLRASGSGAPGTIDATCAITLAPAGAHGTRVSYEADAAVGGTVAGVGQRVLAGVAKRTAAQFFTAIDAELATPAAEDPPPAELGAAGGPAGAGAVAAPAAGAAGPAAPAGDGGVPAPFGAVFPGRPQAAAAPPAGLTHLLAAVVGAAIALAGVLVGRRSA